MAGEIKSGDERRIYPADLQPLLQSLLGTLADIAFEHECEVARVKGSTLGDSMKRDQLRKLEERYRERREPYLIDIGELQQRIDEAVRRAA